jgi:hypothetical protein
MIENETYKNHYKVTFIDDFGYRKTVYIKDYKLVDNFSSECDRER